MCRTFLSSSFLLLPLLNYSLYSLNVRVSLIIKKLIYSEFPPLFEQYNFLSHKRRIRTIYSTFTFWQPVIVPSAFFFPSFHFVSLLFVLSGSLWLQFNFSWLVFFQRIISCIVIFKVLDFAASVEQRGKIRETKGEWMNSTEWITIYIWFHIPKLDLLVWKLLAVYVSFICHSNHSRISINYNRQLYLTFW